MFDDVLANEFGVGTWVDEIEDIPLEFNCSRVIYGVYNDDIAPNDQLGTITAFFNGNDELANYNIRNWRK